MKFTRQIYHGDFYHFSGIYKISSYTNYNGRKCPRYYHVFYIQPNESNWGDYVGGRKAQYDKQLTLAQCKELCIEHAKIYEPTPKQLKRAVEVQSTWKD